MCHWSLTLLVSMVTADFYISITFHDFWFCCDKNIRSPKMRHVTWCSLADYCQYTFCFIPGWFMNKELCIRTSSYSCFSLRREFEARDLLLNSDSLRRFTSEDEMTILPSLWRSSLLRTCWQFGLFWFLFWSGLLDVLQISQTVSDSLGSTGSAGCWVSSDIYPDQSTVSADTDFRWWLHHLSLFLSLFLSFFLYQCVFDPPL